MTNTVILLIVVNIIPCVWSQDICDLRKSKGPCKAVKVSYFYHSKSGSCKKFIYGGCLGNRNNFKTKGQCERRCLKKGFVSCGLPTTAGTPTCMVHFEGYFYEPRGNRCIRVGYSACRPDRRSYNTREECERECDLCPKGWRLYGNKCLLLDETDGRSYREADFKCRGTPGATMVMPKSVWENRQLMQFIILNRPSHGHFWVGLTAQYRWNDGTQLKSWTNWNDGNLKRCTLARLTNAALTWFPVHCHLKSATICQKPPNVTRGEVMTSNVTSEV